MILRLARSWDGKESLLVNPWIGVAFFKTCGVAVLLDIFSGLPSCIGLEIVSLLIFPCCFGGVLKERVSEVPGLGEACRFR